ncbi:MAG TPA: CAP domain-containing protein [Albitalea sp.]|nr:CAP domain-containing protein [Albitalea sp.]
MPRPTRAAALLAASLALLPSASIPAHAQRTPSVADAARLVVAQTNEFRQSQGLVTLTPNAQLNAAAREFADFVARTDRYSHEADGREPAQRAQAHGYDYCLVAENIAYEYSSEGFATQELARDLVEGWKHSPGHRRNMLDDAAAETGVAIAQSARTGRYYAVQIFGRPQSMRVRFSVANRTSQTLHYDIGGKTYPLPPRMTRTHEQCRADALSLKLPGDAAVTRFVPANGQRYRIEPAGDRLRLMQG